MSASPCERCGRASSSVIVSLDVALVRAFDLCDDWEAIADQTEGEWCLTASQLRACAHDLRVRLTGGDL